MEQPNLSYIDQLARGDDSVKKTLIEVIKNEFPDEKKVYLESLKSNNLEKIASNVHRIKHKFSILGLETSYKNAVEYEQSLRNDQLKSISKEQFETTLSAISKYLKTI
jgi:HPt (histidine-containing phosphotransfer) domain-containing protein|tara:strand:+ start:900 stop:1223 length:324 start_codon:yes stop_codon:yes gene_type:complete